MVSLVNREPRLLLTINANIHHDPARREGAAQSADRSVPEHHSAGLAIPAEDFFRMLGPAKPQTN